MHVWHGKQTYGRLPRVGEQWERILRDDNETVPANETIDERYVVPGLSRGLALLQLFTRERPEQKLTELAEGLGLTRSAAYRLVYTLEKEGFLARDTGTRRYRVTPRVLNLGFEYLYSRPLTSAAQPYLIRLSEQTRATAYLMVLDGWETVTLSRVLPVAPLITTLQIGRRIPAHLSASGRAMLSNFTPEALKPIYRRIAAECRNYPVPPSFDALLESLSEDRRRGYVLSPSIFEPSITSCAAAVLDGSGPIGALAAIAPHSFVEETGGEAAVSSLVLDATRSLSAQLGHRA